MWNKLTSVVKSKKYRDLVIFLSFFSGILTLKANTLSLPPHWDGFNLVQGFAPGPLMPFQRLFLSVAKNITPGNASFVLLLHICIIFVSSITCYLTYKVGKKLYNNKIGLLASILLLVSPQFFIQSGIIYWWIAAPLPLLLVLNWGVEHLKERRLEKISIISALAIFTMVFALSVSVDLSKFLGIVRGVMSTHIFHSVKYLFFTNGRILMVPFIFLSLMMGWKKENRIILYFTLVGLGLVLLHPIYPGLNYHHPRQILLALPFFSILTVKSLHGLLKKKHLYIAISIFLVISASFCFKDVEGRTQTGLERSMEYTDSVKAHQKMAEYIENEFSQNAIILTTRPQFSEIAIPTLGYVDKPIPIIEMLWKFQNFPWPPHTTKKEFNKIQGNYTKEVEWLGEHINFYYYPSEVLEKINDPSYCPPTVNPVFCRSNLFYVITFRGFGKEVHLKGEEAAPFKSIIPKDSPYLLYTASEEFPKSSLALDSFIRHYNLTLIKEVEEGDSWARLYKINTD